MNILSLFAATVIAAESIISPLTPDYKPPVVEPSKPIVSFSELALPEVLGEEESVLEASSSSTPTPTQTPAPVVRRTKKSTMTIALLGDSMTDTLGPEALHLKNALHGTYPNTTFIIKNFGVGGEPIDSGINRITNGYTYLGSSHPSLVSTNPDLVVVESFGYNPTGNDQGALDHHWLDLAHVVDLIRNNLPGTKIVIAATIAPNSNCFGDGAPGISFSPEDKLSRTTTIKAYIETAIKFAASQRIPLANAYTASRDSSGNGKLTYINSGDHIHYSDQGRVLMGSKITGTIVGNKLLE